MAFRDTQLGRFGQFCSTSLATHGEPDIRAAHALAADGSWAPRPLLHAVLDSKKLNQDPAWVTLFKTLRATYIASGGKQLTGDCTRPWPSQPSGFCMHELTPPLRHGSLRSFAGTPATNVMVRPNGTTGVDRSVQPLWNYAITLDGEILIAAEDFGWIKHTSIAGGRDVWSAGQVGIDAGQIRLADVQSGHYILGGATTILPGSAQARRLIAFTEDVFLAYFAFFTPGMRHSAFACVWV